MKRVFDCLLILSIIVLLLTGCNYGDVGFKTPKDAVAKELNYNSKSITDLCRINVEDKVIYIFETEDYHINASILDIITFDKDKKYAFNCFKDRCRFEQKINYNYARI